MASVAPVLGNAADSPAFGSMRARLAAMGLMLTFAAGCETYAPDYQENPEKASAVPEITNLNILASEECVTVLGETKKIVALSVTAFAADGVGLKATKLVGPGKFEANFDLQPGTVEADVRDGNGFGETVDIASALGTIGEMPSK